MTRSATSKAAVRSDPRPLLLVLVFTLVVALAIGLTMAVAQAAGSGGGDDDRPRERTTQEIFEDAEDAIDSADYEAAIPLLNQVNAKEPGKADVLNYLGFAHRKLGDLDKAEAFYLDALKADPQHRGALEYYGELHLMRGETAKAEALLVQLVALCPQGCEERDELEAAIAEHKAKPPG